MDIKVLRNFVEIVDSGSLTAASKKLFIAQPALSNQLKALEKELNTLLIERNSRHQKLTDAGRLFYQRAKSIIFHENALFQEIGAAREGDVGCLKIATIQSGEMNLLQEILPLFAEKYPRITYEFLEKENEDTLQMLSDGIVEIGVISTPFSPSPEMDVIYISDENLVLAYDPERFDFSTASRELSLRDLADQPIILTRRYEKMFLGLCRDREFTPNIRSIGKQISINIKWAEAGLGVALVPESSLSYSNKRLAYKSIADGDLRTGRAIVTMKNGFHSKAVENFLALCKRIL
ncbi:MAG: LysR family transcriptional regulator [Clostridia bacterium]|nr:LysR family transcriptional regulator [Clostridia bacterium]